MSTSTEHGARPVPLPNAAAQFTVVAQPNGHDALRPAEPRGRVEPLPDDRDDVLELARRLAPMKGKLRRGPFAVARSCRSSASKAARAAQP